MYHRIYVKCSLSTIIPNSAYPSHCFFFLVFFLLYCFLSCLHCYTETCATYQKCIYSPQGPVLIWWAGHYIAWIDGLSFYIYYSSMLFKINLLPYYFLIKISVDCLEKNTIYDTQN